HTRTGQTGAWRPSRRVKIKRPGGIERGVCASNIVVDDQVTPTRESVFTHATRVPRRRTPTVHPQHSPKAPLTANNPTLHHQPIVSTYLTLHTHPHPILSPPHPRWPPRKRAS